VTKLLIVDDEPYTVDMLQTFLQINGYETVGALNGEDGLVLVRVEQPDIVILDLMLPDIEGFEVCERIRSYPPTTNLPVLIISARNDAAAKERARAAGANGYLVKPVQFAELLSELNRLLSLKRDIPTVSAEPYQTRPDPVVDPDDTLSRRDMNLS
jgi:DNA-binding response OmpR family regulator